MKISPTTSGGVVVAALAVATVLLSTVSYARARALASRGDYDKGVSQLLPRRPISGADARFQPAAFMILAGAEAGREARMGRIAVSRTIVKHKIDETTVFTETIFRSMLRPRASGAEMRPLTGAELVQCHVLFGHIDLSKARNIRVGADGIRGDVTLQELGISQAEFNALVRKVASQKAADAAAALGG